MADDQRSALARQQAAPMPSVYAIPLGKSTDQHPLELLSAEQQQRLARCSTLVRLRKGAIVFGEGSESRYLYNLSEGMIETYHVHGDGQRRITAFMFPNDLFGMSENGRYCMTAQAVTPVVAYRIPIVQLARLMHEDPDLQLHLLCKACHEIRESQQHILQIGHTQARARIAAFLLLIARHNHAANGSDDAAAMARPLALPMSRSDIADFSALTIESVSRALRALEESGLIRRDSTNVISILDHEGLCREAGDF